MVSTPLLRITLATALLSSCSIFAVELATKTPGGNPVSGRLMDVTPDGRFLLISSSSDELPHPNQLYLFDTTNGSFEIVSLTIADDPIPFGTTSVASVSDDGNRVCFFSIDNTVVPGDPSFPTGSNIFVRDRNLDTTFIASLSDSDETIPFGVSPGYFEISGNGRFVVFDTVETGLVAGDPDAVSDILVRDLEDNETFLVSVNSSEIKGNEHCTSPSISFDGNLISFLGCATNLVANDTNLECDVFVRNMSEGETERVSLTHDDLQQTGGGSNKNCKISGNGEAVVFSSTATNLVPADENGIIDVFVRDLVDGTTERVSVSSSGQEPDTSPFLPRLSISSNGRYVGFTGSSPILDSRMTFGAGSPTGFFHDRETAETEIITINNNGDFAGTEEAEPRPVDSGEYFFESGLRLVPLPTNDPITTIYSSVSPTNVPTVQPIVAPSVPAAKVAILAKTLKKLKKRLKNAKRKRQFAKAKKFKKKIKKTKRQLKTV